VLTALPTVHRPSVVVQAARRTIHDRPTAPVTPKRSAPIPTVLPAVTAIISTVLPSVVATPDTVRNHRGRAHDRRRAGDGCPDDPAASSAS